LPVQIFQGRISQIFVAQSPTTNSQNSATETLPVMLLGHRLQPSYDFPKLILFAPSLFRLTLEVHRCAQIDLKEGFVYFGKPY